MNFIIVNTVYQLFNVINMRLNNIITQNSVLILTDHTPMLHSYIPNLKSSKLFSEVKYIINLSWNKKFSLYSLEEQTDVFDHPEISLSKITGWDNIKFNRCKKLYISNLDVMVRLVSNINCDFELIRYEDGTLNYVGDIKLQDEAKNYIQKFKVIHERIREEYLYTPELIQYNSSYIYRIIPTINKNNLDYKSIFNFIFNYKAIDIPSVIFLEHNFHEDGWKNNEFEYIYITLEIAKNTPVAVKPHPRSKVSRIKLYGLSDKTIPVQWEYPFELILLNNDMKDKFLITMHSTAALSNKIIFNEDTNIILLHKGILWEHTYVFETNLENYLRDYINKYNNENIYTPLDIDEYANLLKQLIDKENFSDTNI